MLGRVCSFGPGLTRAPPGLGDDAATLVLEGVLVVGYSLHQRVLTGLALDVFNQLLCCLGDLEQGGSGVSFDAIRPSRSSHFFVSRLISFVSLSPSSPQIGRAHV